MIENPFRCTDPDGSSLPSYASPTVASRIRMSMSTDKLATDELPVCHRYSMNYLCTHTVGILRITVQVFAIEILNLFLTKTKFLTICQTVNFLMFILHINLSSCLCF